MIGAHNRRLGTERERVGKLRLLKAGLMEDLLTGPGRVPSPLEQGAG